MKRISFTTRRMAQLVLFLFVPLFFWFCHTQILATRATTSQRIALLWPEHTKFDPELQYAIDFSARECSLHGTPADKAVIRACLQYGAKKVDAIDPARKASERLAPYLKQA